MRYSNNPSHIKRGHYKKNIFLDDLKLSNHLVLGNLRLEIFKRNLEILNNNNDIYEF